jgi:hypothetical protein
LQENVSRWSCFSLGLPALSLFYFSRSRRFFNFVHSARHMVSSFPLSTTRTVEHLDQALPAHDCCKRFPDDAAKASTLLQSSASRASVFSSIVIRSSRCSSCGVVEGTSTRTDGGCTTIIRRVPQRRQNSGPADSPPGTSGNNEKLFRDAFYRKKLVLGTWYFGKAATIS